MEIDQAVKALLTIIESLKQAYPQKKFTLDGRLVGDLGEILVETDYNVALFEKIEPHYDGLSGKKKVQIKTTMKNSLTVPHDHIPEYYLGIKIHPDGTYTEIYNGPGKAVHQLIQKRARTQNNLHSVSIARLTELNPVDPAQKIPVRIAKK